MVYHGYNTVTTNTDDPVPTNPVIIEPTTEAPIVTPDIEVPYIEAYAQAPIYTPIEDPYIEDLIIMASILQAECWEGDWRQEATVILNRTTLPIGHFMNPDGTIQGVIEASGQFDGTSRSAYINRSYTDKAYNAAYEVLVEGYRSFGEEIIYFANIETSTDQNFIESINWVYLQENERSHSFGKDY